ncbi:LysR family transcriptional regulator [Endozoicomonadaceae bacterium StTr2]
MLLPFKSLLVFEAVTRNASFTKAADELNVTQSAISHQIRNLENYFSIKLLDRSGSTLVLTDEGKILFRDLSSALAIIRNNIGKLKASAEATSVGISVRSHFAMKWLAPRLQNAPFDFDFHFFHTNESADFSDPLIHLSIEWLREDHVHDGARLLFPGKLTPACHPDLLKHLKVPYKPEMLSQNILLHENDSASWQEWLQLAGLEQLQPVRNEYYSDTNVRQQAAAEKLGFALVHPDLIKGEIAEGRLCCPFSEVLTTYSYYLKVPDDRLNISNVRTFVNWLDRESRDNRGSVVRLAS